MLIPTLDAFCLIAPGVRFIAREILTTGVLLFECALREQTSCFVQATRLARLLCVFRLNAMFHLSVWTAVRSISSRSSVKHFLRIENTIRTKTVRKGNSLTDRYNRDGLTIAVKRWLGLALKQGVLGPSYWPAARSRREVARHRYPASLPVSRSATWSSIRLGT
jgi:hypothetical protein